MGRTFYNGILHNSFIGLRYRLVPVLETGLPHCSSRNSHSEVPVLCNFVVVHRRNSSTMTTKAAIVTGSNKGIGLAIVRRMCKEFGGDVILTARDGSRGQTAVSLLEGEGLQPKFHQLDIDSRDSIATLKEFIEKKYGGTLDLLVGSDLVIELLDHLI